MMFPPCFQAGAIALGILIFLLLHQHVLTLLGDPHAQAGPAGLCSPLGTPCVHGFPHAKSSRTFTGFDFKEQVSSHLLGRTLVLGPAHFQAGFQAGKGWRPHGSCSDDGAEAASNFLL